MFLQYICDLTHKSYGNIISSWECKSFIRIRYIYNRDLEGGLYFLQPITFFLTTIITKIKIYLYIECNKNTLLYKSIMYKVLHTIYQNEIAV